MYLLHSRWFRLSVEQFDMLHYAGMSIFKLGIILLNVVPYIALESFVEHENRLTENLLANIQARSRRSKSSNASAGSKS